MGIFYLFCILFAAFGIGLAVYLSIDSTDNLLSLLILWSADIFLLFLSGYGFYRFMRPRVKVNGEKLICYPRFEKKTEINAGDITARVVTPIYNSSFPNGGISYPNSIPSGVRITGSRIRFNPLQAAIRGSAPNGMGSGGILNSTSRTSAVYESICYRIGEKDIITIHTEMKNALLLDGFICALLKKSSSE